MDAPRRNKNQPMVITQKDLCRVCYTCVRECPAKAIRIVEGQAEVIPERCIGCGNCVTVCSQKAKKVSCSIEEVFSLLKSGSKTAAIVAPSFPAEFSEWSYDTLVGMIRELGFDLVCEVGFGADLVARETKRMLNETDERYIASSCPGVFGFVKRYNPGLIKYLMPVVSPMIAMARVVRSLHNDENTDVKIVFIGPCIAKMGEACSDEMNGEIDEVLTFGELRSMFGQREISAEHIEPSDFDPPHAGTGSLFPVLRGLLQAADIPEDLILGEVVSASGRDKFIEALEEFESGDLNARLLDVLCCDGCIMGAGMTTTAPLYRRRARISQHARAVTARRNAGEWRRYMGCFRDLDISRVFIPFDQRLSEPDETTVREIMLRMGKKTPKDELNCGACGYATCRAHAVAIHKGLAESEMCLPYMIEQLNCTIAELNLSNTELDEVRASLLQSEKLAGMGQLAAGIAHEVNNPLGVVLMYAHLLLEEAEKGTGWQDDLQMIVQHADRAKKIVAGLLQFARQNKVTREEADIIKVIDDFLKVKTRPEGIKVVCEHQLDDPVISIDKDQICQLLTNITENANAAMQGNGTLTIRTFAENEMVCIRISDTGPGIPVNYRKKIFEPFFTTKKEGQGTGLGLSISYGIIKMHSGKIEVTSNTDPNQGPTGTTFEIRLPRMDSMNNSPEKSEAFHAG